MNLHGLVILRCPVQIIIVTYFQYTSLAHWYRLSADRAEKSVMMMIMMMMMMMMEEYGLKK